MDSCSNIKPYVSKRRRDGKKKKSLDVKPSTLTTIREKLKQNPTAAAAVAAPKTTQRKRQVLQDKSSSEVARIKRLAPTIVSSRHGRDIEPKRIAQAEEQLSYNLIKETIKKSS